MELLMVMRLTSILFGWFVLPLLMTAESPSDKINDLSPLQWKYRIILLFPEAGAVEVLAKELERHQAEIGERDIVWFIASTDGVKTNYPEPLAESFVGNIHRQYNGESSDPSIFLIGKDGGIKGRYTRLDLPAIFARIDSMPMRQAEMRRR